MDDDAIPVVGLHRGVPLEDLVNEIFEWKPGWEYRLDG